MVLLGLGLNSPEAQAIVRLQLGAAGQGNIISRTRAALLKAYNETGGVRLVKSKKAEDKEAGRAKIAELDEPTVIALYDAMTNYYIADVRRAGSTAGTARNFAGQAVGEVSVADYSKVDDPRPKDFMHRAAQTTGLAVSEFDVMTTDRKTRSLLYRPTELNQHLKAFWYGSLSYIADGPNNGHMPVKTADTVNEHMISIVAADLGRIIQYHLPGKKNAKQFAAYLRRLAGTQSGDVYNNDGLITIENLQAINDADMYDTVSLMREFATLLEGGPADKPKNVTDESIWAWARSRKLPVKNIFELVTMVESYSVDGMVAAKTSEKPLKFLSRYHQIMAKSNRHISRELYEAAQAVSLARSRSRERSHGAYGVDVENNEMRIVVVDDSTYHNMMKELMGGTDVTFMDSFWLQAKHVVETVATSAGYDVGSGDYGSWKGSLLGVGLGADGRGGILTKTQVGCMPQYEAMMRAADIAGIVSETGAKLLFGEVSGFATFRLSDGTHSGDMQAIARDVAAGHTPTLSDRGMVKRVPLDSIRFGKMIHSELEDASVSLQTEVWQDAEFINAAAKFTNDDDVRAAIDMLVGVPDGDQMALARRMFDQTLVDDDGDDSVAKMALDSHPLAHSGLLGNGRSYNTKVKNLLLKDRTFKGRSTAGSKSTVVPDLAGAMRPSAHMAPGKARGRLINPDETFIGIEHESMEFDEVDRHISAVWGLRDGHHFNTQSGDPDLLTESRKTRFVPYSLRGAGGAIERGLTELVAGIDNPRKKRLGGSAGSSKLSAIHKAAFREAAATNATRGEPAPAPKFAAAMQGAFDTISRTGNGGCASWAQAEPQIRATLKSSLGRVNSPFVGEIMDELAVAHQLYWQGAKATGRKTTMGNVHDALGAFLGWKPNTEYDASGKAVYSPNGFDFTKAYRDSDEGLAPVNFGITTVSQRSPHLRITDSIISHIMGFHDDEMGNVMTMNHFDGVGNAELDFDGDFFNWWADSPKTMLKKWLESRNSTGSLAAPKAGQPDDHNWLSKTDDIRSDSAFKYAQEQAVATGMRGMVAKAQRVAHKAILDQVTLHLTDAQGNPYQLRPKFRSVQEVHDNPSSVMKTITWVQHIIDTKKGTLENKFKPKSLHGQFDPAGDVLAEFYELVRVDEDGHDVVGAAEHLDVGGEERELIKAVMAPYSRLLTITGSIWEGEGSRQASSSELLDVAAGYVDIFGDKNTLQAKLQANLNAIVARKEGRWMGDSSMPLAAGKGKAPAQQELVVKGSGPSVRVSLNHKPTGIERAAHQVVAMDDILYNRWLSGTGAMVTEARGRLSKVVQEGHESQRITASVGAWNGSKRDLAKIVNEEIANLRSGFGDRDIAEIRIKQLRNLLNRDGSEVRPLDLHQPQNGHEMDRFMENTIMGYSWEAARRAHQDNDVDKAGHRILVMQGVAGKYRQMIAKYMEQSSKDINEQINNPTKASNLLSMEAIESVIVTDLQMALDLYDGDLEAAILDLIKPQEDGAWMHQGAPQLHYRDFPRTLLAIAAKVAPNETRPIVASLVKNQIALTHMFAGDPLAYYSAAKQSRDSADTASLRAMNKGLYGSMQHDQALEIAVKLTESELYNKSPHAIRRLEMSDDGAISTQHIAGKGRIGIDRRMAAFVRSYEKAVDPDRFIAERAEILRVTDVWKSQRAMRYGPELALLDEGIHSLEQRPIQHVSEIVLAKERDQKRLADYADRKRQTEGWDAYKRAPKDDKPNKPTPKPEADKQADAERSAAKMIANSLKATGADYYARYEQEKFPAFVETVYADLVKWQGGRWCSK